MLYPALSIVAPNGTNIVEGRKLIEVRSWLPEQLPLKNLVIVENQNFLSQCVKEEQGWAVAIVDIESVHPWLKTEVDIACANHWEDGYFAWVIAHVRPINPPIQTTAKRKIYTLDLHLNS